MNEQKDRIITIYKAFFSLLYFCTDKNYAYIDIQQKLQELQIYNKNLAI